MKWKKVDTLYLADRFLGHFIVESSETPISLILGDAVSLQVSWLLVRHCENK